MAFRKSLLGPTKHIGTALVIFGHDLRKPNDETSPSPDESDVRTQKEEEESNGLKTERDSFLNPDAPKES